MSVDSLLAYRRGLLEQQAQARRPVDRVLPIAVTIFLISIWVPFQVPLGPLQLSASRTVLLVLLIPMALALLRGEAGRTTLSDIGLLFFCVWVLLSMSYNHGLFQSIEYIGIMVIETMGAFLLGRTAIRNADAFEAMVRTMFWIILILAPFALFETITGYNVLLHLANAIIPSQPEVRPLRRMGLERVQATLDHPIHFGIVVGMMVAPVFGVLGYGRRATVRLGRAVLTGLTAFFSLSSGALIMIFSQISMFVWGGLLKRLKDRWRILVLIVAGLAVFEYFTGFFVNLLINEIAYDPKTAFNRTRILRFALENVKTQPLFGIGQNEWINIPGMSDSVDMFWMLITMMHGVPAGVLMAFGFLWMPLALAARDMPDARTQAYRETYLITIAALFIGLWTVHVWREAYVFVLFFLGSGSWMLERPEDPVGFKSVRSAGRSGRRDIHRPAMMLERK